MVQARANKTRGKQTRGESKGSGATKKLPAGVSANVAAEKPNFKRRKRTTKEESQSVKTGQSKVSAAYQIFGRAAQLLVRHWKLFAGILAVYALLNLILVGGASASNLQSAKSTLSQVAHGHLDNLTAGFTLFAFLVSSSSSPSSAAASAYQTMLLLLISVVLIWALRQVYAAHAVRVRDAFYTGAYPIVPFILVLLVIGLQLVPLAIGSLLYGSLVGGGITVGLFEQAIALVVFFLLAVWSLYMISSSVFALYIVTLPEVTPFNALRSARELVHYRRWVVLRKMLFLPLALLAIGAIIVIPFALFVTPLATALFFGLSVVGLAMVHSYMYALYRELL